MRPISRSVRPGEPRIGTGELYKAQVDWIDGGRQAGFVKWTCPADDANVGESLRDLQRTDGGIRTATRVPENGKARDSEAIRERDYICGPIADPAARLKLGAAEAGPIGNDNADLMLLVLADASRPPFASSHVPARRQLRNSVIARLPPHPAMF